MVAAKSEINDSKLHLILKGFAVSDGVVLARALRYAPQTLVVAPAYLQDAPPQEAIAAVESALSKADADLAALIDSFPADEAEQAKIFAAHREILADEDLRQTILDNIEAERMSAEYAVYAACETFIELLKKAESETIALRAADVADVRGRLLLALRGETKRSLSQLSEDCILVAHDLLPSDTATMDRTHVLGIVTEIGSETSHTAILARSFRIPALVGVQNALSTVQCAQTLLLDAETGELTLSPSAEEATAARQKRVRWLARQSAADACLLQPALAKSGERFQIGLNIGSDSEEIPAHFDFVGLFRTEFLYMNATHLPTENEQFAAYCNVLKNAGGRPVTLRTLDIGGDKTLRYMQLPKEDNPFLGKRALRLCFDEPDLFLTQLRAALRASAFGRLQIMFPMVGSVDDIRRAKTFVETAKTELRARNEAFDEHIRLGIMIEVPSIAMTADLAAQEVDFASIGTNDLCQYVFAADRMNAELSSYCQPFSPAFVRVLGHIISSFQVAKKELSMCGELAGNPRAAALLAGLGLRKFSMSGASAAGMKLALSKIGMKESEALAAKAAKLATQADVVKLINELPSVP